MNAHKQDLVDSLRILGDRGGWDGVYEMPSFGRKLKVIASSGLGWLHVSVSHPRITPSWDEMCAVKAAFFGPDRPAFQLHPVEDQHVNLHEHCLHLWWPLDREVPLPALVMV